jgi:hypothetical protein
MAAELFSTFADFKNYTGGRVNTSMELDSLNSTIYETARRHIVPYLSQSEYDALVTASQGIPTSAQQTLLPFVKRALAVLTMYEWSKVGGIEVGDAGMHRIETETRKAAYRYQEKAYQEDAREKGYDNLELMLKYLTDNAATYTAWAATDEAAMHRGMLLNYATTFRLHTDHNIDRYSFEALRPIISSIESFGVEQVVPATFWTGFKSRHIAGTLTTPEKTVRDMMRKAIAHKALEEATVQHWVRIKGGRVVLIEEFGEQNQYNATTPQGSHAALSQRNVLWSDRYTNAWKKYMNDNPTLFATAFDVASGGTNTADDAWHINTEAEQDEADDVDIELKSGPVFQL